MADNFKLPGSSYEEIIKIIKAYSSGKEGQAQPLDAIQELIGQLLAEIMASYYKCNC